MRVCFCYVITCRPLSTQISQPNTFWDWMHENFLPTYYSGDWYNGKTLNWREALQIDDRSTIRVGVARLRQLRIKDGE